MIPLFEHATTFSNEHNLNSINNQLFPNNLLALISDENTLPAISNWEHFELNVPTMEEGKMSGDSIRHIGGFLEVT